MTLQAFIDESETEGGFFVLGGYIATAESWSSFAGEWETLLRKYGRQKKDGRYHFKMKEMARVADSAKRTELFFRVIEDHVIGWVSARINKPDLKKAISRIVVPGLEIDWGSYANPYFITFRCLVDMFHIHRPEMVEAMPLGEKIDFFFDDRTDKKPILDMWENYIAARPDAIKEYYGAMPRFEDDMDFLPLQAADYWAWWVRKWCVDGTPEKIAECNFGDFGLLGNKKFLRVDICFDEAALVTSLVKSLRQQLDIKHPIVILQYA